MPAPLIIAVPKGRILAEALPLLARAGVRPEAAFSDEDSRALRFLTDDPGIELIRVRAFDVATFVAHGAAQLGIVGSDVLMEFDYSELYAPVDLDIGHCRLSVAEPVAMAAQVGVAIDVDPPRRDRLVVGVLGRHAQHLDETRLGNGEAVGGAMLDREPHQTNLNCRPIAA